jgi:mRNA interferase MazF
MKDPVRGEVWRVDLGLAAKVRPGLVLSVRVEGDERALVTIVTHTTSPRGTPYEVDVKAKYLQPGVFDGQNIVTIPRPKFVKKLGATDR